MARLLSDWVCCGVARVVRVGVAIGRFLLGAVLHVFNFDLGRLGDYLADQNHYDHIFDEIAGRPREVGGLLECFREIFLGFDDRLYCLVDLFIKPAKSIVEGLRAVAIAGVRLINTILGTGEPGIEDYICIVGRVDCVDCCIDLEAILVHWRRTRGEFYNPFVARTEARTDIEPAFIDCVCYWFNFRALQDFLDDPPPAIPDFCCFINNVFRWLVENAKLLAELIITLIESVITIFDPNRPLTLVFVEWAACVTETACTNVADITSDLEDLFSCPCVVVIDIDDIFSPPPEQEFYCICDAFSGFVQWWINLQRSTLLFTSNAWALIWCLGNGVPVPECTVELHTRFATAFNYLELSAAALSQVVGSIGCFLGLPWRLFDIDCLGTTYTWPHNHPDCDISGNFLGPDMIPCTMSDRLSQVFAHLFDLILVMFKYVWRRIQLMIDIAFGLVSVFTGPPLETSISEAIGNFFLDIRDPLFGTSAVEITNDFQDVVASPPWPNLTGIDLGEYVQQEVNDTGDVIQWQYEEPASQVIYGRTFNVSRLTCFDPFNVSGPCNATVGLVQTVGLTINCLLGPPTVGCMGPLLFEPSEIEGDTGCFGDLLIVAGNVIRDIYTAIVEFIVAGLYILEALFTDPSMLAFAVIDFLQKGFVVLYLIVESVAVIAEALLSVIIEVARFVLGDGVAEILRFMLETMAAVVEVFIQAIEFIIEPFFNKRSLEHVPDPLGFYKVKETQKHPPSLEDAVDIAFNRTLNRTNAEDLNWRKVLESFEKYYDASREKKRNFGPTPEPASQPNVPDGRRSVSMKDFDKKHAEQMTDDTMCKKIMMKLSDLKRFDGMDLAQELMWKACFFAYSLPEEIRYRTKHKIKLPRDAFYNPETGLKLIKEGVLTLRDYFVFRGTNGPSATQPVFTEVLNVPDTVLAYAQLQSLLQEARASKAVNEDDAAFEGVAEDHFKELVEMLREDLENGSEESVKRVANLPGWQKAYVKVFADRLHRKSAPGRGRGEDAWGTSLSEGTCQIKQEGWIPFVGDRQERVCVDTQVASKGFTLKIPYPIRSEATLEAFAKELAERDSGYEWSEKRGLIDMLSGSSLDLNELYNRKHFDDPKSAGFNPFVGTVVTIHTALKGTLYLNVSKLGGRLLPVVDGKVALTHVNMTFLDHLNKIGRDSDLNKELISSYERVELVDAEESYLRLNAKMSYLDDLLKAKGYKANAPPPEASKEDERKHAHRKRWETTKKPTVKEAKDAISELTDRLVAATRSGLDRVRSGAASRARMRKFVRGSLRGFATFLKQLTEYPKKEFRTPTAHFTVRVPEPDLRKKRMAGNWTHEKRSLDFGETLWSVDSARTDAVQDYVDRRNREWRRVMNERKARNVSVWSEWWCEILPETFWHVRNAINGYLGRRAASRDASKKRSLFHRGCDLDALRPDAKVYKYDANAVSVTETIASEVFSWMPGPDGKPSALVNAHGVPLSKSQERYVIHFPDGTYRLYEDVRVLPKMVGGKNVGEPTRADPYVHQMEGHFHPIDAFHAAKESEAETSGADHVVYQVTVNYHEQHYGLKYGKHDNEHGRHKYRKYDCINNTFWSEYRQYDVDLLSKVSDANEMETESAWRCVTELDYLNYLRLRETDPNATSTTVVLELHKCYAHEGYHPRNPLQNNFSSFLQGRSLIGAWLDTWSAMYDRTMANYSARLNPYKMRERFWVKYVAPLVKKYRETYEVHHRKPTVAGGLVLYEKVRKMILGGDSDAWRIPQFLLFNMGHRAHFAEEDDPEIWARSEWENYKTTGWMSGVRQRDPEDYGEEWEWQKRAHQPPLIDVCLPDFGNATETSCTDCRGCSDDAGNVASNCKYCWGCTVSTLGFFECRECGGCRVGFDSHFVGTCIQCTGCATEGACLNCRLVEEFIARAIEIVDFCVQKNILGNQAVVLQPLPNTTLYTLIEFDEATLPEPNIDDYDFTRLPSFIADTLRYQIGRLTGYDVYDSVVEFFTTTNVDPFEGLVGFLYILKFKVPIPLIGRCNRDIHLQCTFGMGLENALIVTTIIFAVIVLLIFLSFGVLGMIFSATGVIPMYFYTVATFAWHWNGACATPPFFGLLTAADLGFLVFPQLPECAMDETFDLLNRTIRRCLDIPACLTTDGITCPDSCSDFISIVNCSDYGFYSLPTVIGYAGQRFIPEPLRFWLVTYLNQTCLVKGNCPIGLPGFNQGPIYPFFDYNFEFDISVDVCRTDNCFYATVGGLFMYLLYIILVAFFLYYAWQVGKLLVELVLKILRLAPIRWFLPFGVPDAPLP